ncbi:MAG: hypothetical protein WBD40_02045, partial [Tepidisphaeraceae bacterium]
MTGKGDAKDAKDAKKEDESIDPVFFALFACFAFFALIPPGGGAPPSSLRECRDKGAKRLTAIREFQRLFCRVFRAFSRDREIVVRDCHEN